MATFKAGQIEREKRPEPFTYETTDGVEVTLMDPQKLHFTVFEKAFTSDASKMQVLRHVCGDSYEHLQNDPAMDMEGITQLFNAWQEHYGMGDQGNAAG